MKKVRMYFRLDLKRMIKTVPILIVGMFIFIILIAGLAVINSTIEKNGKKEFEVINVGVSGSKDDKYTNLVIRTVEKMDTVKYSCKFDYCTKEEAESGIKEGVYDVVFIIPEDYVKGFMHGENKTVEVRSGKGQTGITSYIMKQLSKVAENLVIKTEANIYSLQDFYNEKAPEKEREALIDLNLEYFKRILARSSSFFIEEVDVTDGMSMAVYYFCDAIVLIFLFMGLQCSKLLQKNDLTMERQLCVSGLNSLGQVTARWIALMITFFVMYLLFSLAVTVIMPFAEKNQFIITNGIYSSFFIRLLKAAVMLIPACAFILFVYELFEDTAGGVLCLFVLIIGLGFMAGCFYPLSFMPEPVRILSSFTVTRAMFCYVSGCISGEISTGWMLVLFLHTALFFVTTVILRKRKMTA